MKPPESVLSSPARLAALHRTGLLDSAEEEAFDRLTRLASRLLRSPVALVCLVDEDRQFFKSHVGLTDQRLTARQTPLSHSFCKFLIPTPEPLVIGNAREHPLVADNPAVPDFGIMAYAGMPLVTDDGQVLGSFCVIDTEPRDWTEEEMSVLRDLAGPVMAEIKLRLAAREAERRARETAAILDAAGEGIFGIDGEGRCTFINPAASRMLGWEPGEALGKEMHSLIHHSCREECPIFRVLETGEACCVESDLLWRRDHTPFHARYSASPVIEEGVIRGAVATFTDITQRVRLEEERLRLLASERQKTEQLKLLVREAHHRIKNNLQAMADLLYLEEVAVPQDADTRQSLRNSMDRISAIALVHDLLSQDEDVRTVDFRAVAERLVPMVLGNMNAGLDRAALEMEVVSLTFPSKTATALALILCELVSNAAKHATCGRKGLRLRIRFTPGEHGFLLWVKDDGPGLPPDFDMARDAHVGLQVVRTLVEGDLRGRLTLSNEDGVAAQVWFPRSNDDASQKASDL